MTKKLEHKDRREAILVAALRLAEQVGYTQVTRDAAAALAGVSSALVSQRFGTMPAFRRDLMRYAIAQENLLVVAQGLSLRDRHARKASDELRQRAAECLKQ